MNVANLNLCKQLRELSGWKDTYLVWRWYMDWFKNELTEPELVRRTASGVSSLYREPAYDLGYLRQAIVAALNEVDFGPGEYEIWIARLASALVAGEDATAKLAIRLYKERMLTKRGSKVGPKL